MKMFRVIHLGVVALLLFPPLFAQAQDDKWQRVFTGEDFFVDVNPATLSYQPGRILRLQFRTRLSKPEVLNDNARYQTRLETIEFRNDKRYRYCETRLLDSAGKTVGDYSSASSLEWKTFKRGGVTSRLFDAAISLAPFGRWRVTGYRYADEKAHGVSDSEELVGLNGTEVTFEFYGAAVGAERCASPSYESHPLRDNDFYLKLGISPESLGIPTTQGNGIVVKCESHDWAPPQSLILPLQSGRVLMLWKGVFLELKQKRR